jgi:Asp-tRNA(Asn)/Glu-tRNA(Gln) amidotransferase A subunit family amidase
MTYDILVTREAERKYKARVLLLPEIVVMGKNEAEVLNQVKEAIADLRASSHIVRLNVPSLTGEADDPWLRIAGYWQDDPDWEDFQEEIATFRKEIDMATQNNS